MSLQHRPLPLAIRLANRAGALLDRAGLSLLPIDGDALLTEATREVGAGDLGDPAVRAGLDALCRSIREDAHLNLGGRIHARWMIRTALAGRLRFREHLRRDPAAAARWPQHAPLIVCGLPRSGTTFLHRLLAAAPGTRAVPLCELIMPIRPPGPDTRLRDAERRLRSVIAVAPLSLDTQHYMRADLADECAHLFVPMMQSTMCYQLPVHGYVRWYLQQDLRAPYRDYASLLGALDDPPRRLVLKDPYHYGHLDPLFEALPEARVVQLHRDPVETVPSILKLYYTAHAVMTDRVDVPQLAEGVQQILEELVRRNLRFRARGEDPRLLDVSYRDLVADPVQTVRRIHAHFRLDWDQATEKAAAQYAAENRQHKHGVNHYTPEDFGLTADSIKARFAEYRDRFGALFA